MPGYLVLISCQPSSSASTENLNARAEKLASVYCSACHTVPSPSDLDKPTWENYVLPRMGYFVGIYDKPGIRDKMLGKGHARDILLRANIFPENPQIDRAIWKTITAYYIRLAPDTLARMEKVSPAIPIPNFKVRIPEYALSPPSTTFVRFRKTKGLFVGDANSKSFLVFDEKLQLKRAARLDESVVWLEETPGSYNLTVMGSFSPTDAPQGYLVRLPKDAGDRVRKILPGLQRPVHSDIGDLTGDGVPEIVTCEFAKWTGALAWWEDAGPAGMKKHVLRNKPGAIKAYIRDLDGDDDADIIALFGQGDEGIFIYINKGQGDFEEKKVLGFPSSRGSSFFDLIDYNGDNMLDILYTSGDNADYPPVLKPYHGIRIFQNTGNLTFEEIFFYPMNGAYGAVWEDFDMDGDHDIAAIAFFPDFGQNPGEGFIYLENQGNMTFKAYTFEDVNAGRWIVIDAGDLEGDGDTDIVLGALSMEVVPPAGLLERWVGNGIPFVILENQAK